MEEKHVKRSKNLDADVVNKLDTRNLNLNFVKDGYMYLLRGSDRSHFKGFYTLDFAVLNKNMQDRGIDPCVDAHAQVLNGDTHFFSATTNVNVASVYGEKIYVLKVPVEDVYTFYHNNDDLDIEYMIPDCIEEEEIIGIFDRMDFDSIYELLLEKGLFIDYEDIGYNDFKNITQEDIENLRRYTHDFNYIRYYLQNLKEEQIKMQRESFLQRIRK